MLNDDDFLLTSRFESIFFVIARCGIRFWTSRTPPRPARSFDPRRRHPEVAVPGHGHSEARDVGFQMERKEDL